MTCPMTTTFKLTLLYIVLFARSKFCLAPEPPPCEQCIEYLGVTRLEMEIESLKDAYDYIQETAMTLTLSDRLKGEELVAIKGAIQNVLLIKNRLQTNALKIHADTRWMGMIDYTDFHNAYANVINADDPRQGYNVALSFEENEHKAYEEFHELLKNSNWHPFRIVNKDGKDQYEIVPDDSILVRVRENWGQTLCNLLIRAVEELETYNPSGRYSVGIPWDYERDAAVPYAEVVNQIKTVMLKMDESYASLLRFFARVYETEPQFLEPQVMEIEQNY